MPIMDVDYSQPFPGVVEIHLPDMNVRLNKANLLVAIENIKNQRSLYATDAAYQKMLGAYQGALEFLEQQEGGSNGKA